MDVKNTLINIGLSERETNVYLAALELGTSSVQDIAQQSDEKRSTVYDVIDKLKKKKLITETRQGSRRLFTASSPSELRVMLIDHEQMLEEILPVLKGMAGNNLSKPKIQVFNGIKEVGIAYSDTLNSRPHEILTIESSDSVIGRMGLGWTNAYIAERVRKNIPVRLITTASDIASELASKDKDELRQTKILSKGRKFTTDIEIYGNKVLFLSFKKEITGFLIESEEMHNAMKTMFEIMWNA
jgi:sugar-specific transcriptional regulator TrmB